MSAPISSSHAHRWHFIALTFLAIVLNHYSFAESAGPVRVDLIKSDDRWELRRDSKPYFIKGGGGDESKELLSKLGGNSFRTWGVGDNTQRELDEAQKLGLTVTLGIWLRHESDGFNYNDPKQVEQQF